MSVFKRKNSKYYIIQFRLNGKTFIKSSKSTKKATAQMMETKWREELLLNQQLGITDKPQIKISDAIDKFLATKEGGLRYSGYATVAKSLRTHYIKQNKNVDELITTDIYNYVEYQRQRGLMDSLLKTHMNFMRRMFAYLKDLEYKMPPACSFPSLKSIKSRTRVPTDSEIEKILAELEPLHQAAFSHSVIQSRQDAYDLAIVLIDMGIRKNEAIIIPWTAVDFKNNVIHIYRPKVKNQSLIPMTNRVRVLMERRYKTKRNDWVFPSRDGKTHRTGDVQAISAAIKRAGVNDPEIVKQTGDTITTHSFRKYFASTLISNGVPIYTVSQLLGHSDVKTTIQAYSFLINNDQFEKAIDILNNEHTQKVKLKIVK